MIGRRSSKIIEEKIDPKGFDDFELRLGDMMRGERATMGKSLLDVQRELRIKASYIAAIENSDPEAFDTPGFIAGYVRSYARYLNMDPDHAFDVFCAESGFSVAHGMSAEASVVKKPSREERLSRGLGADIFATPNTPFVPTGDSIWSRVEPGAIGSSLVLLALISAIGFGGYSVLQEVQRVQVAPVDQTPVVMADLDPLESAARVSSADVNSDAPQVMNEPRADALDRLYRPQALDVPVLVPRDAPIANIDPGAFGSFTAPTIDTSPTLAGVTPDSTAPAGIIPQVVEGPVPDLQMVAAYKSWVRVKSADGSTIFEAVMEKGDTWTVPATEEPPVLRTGESGAIYFAMADGCYGPVGGRGSVTSNLPLHRQALAELYEPVKIQDDSVLIQMVADLSELDPLKALPCVTN
ncbi:RodZ domain-containing protein [Pseudosulfitobacter sp. SM2401]|uniref:helix-turn-helix domain-containing protein n=1 Tax=Pseudosulfitobacter sp. SM2401 TaxID=3350098 RepID=UPI0036F2934B